MRTRLLVGLVAVALGGLTSCGNILEENGIANSVAESGMGELRINLSTDASLNVSTKATGDVVSSGVSLTDEQMKQFQLSATKEDVTKNLGNYGSYTSQLPKGEWTVKAVYTSMNESTILDWNTPNFEGSETVTIVANKTAEPTISAALTNSIIKVDKDAFNQLTTDGATIEEVFVYAGTEEEASSTVTKYVFYKEGNTLEESNKLFVKKDAANVRIVIKGHLTNDESKTFEVNRLIADNNGSTTSAKKLYNVVYSLNQENGSVSLTITIDGQVTEQVIDVNVDPYTPSNQSN